MEILAFSNQKGGVGKTTLTTQTARLAAEQGLKVLVVEFDTQGHATYALTGSKSILQDADATKSVLTCDKLFTSDCSDLPLNVGKNIWLIPATRELIDVENLTESELTLPRINLQKLKNDFDICIIDTPPNTGKALWTALIAATKIVIPTTLDIFSLEGLNDTFMDIGYIKEQQWNTEIEIIGIQINKRGRSGMERRQHAEFTAVLKENGILHLLNESEILDRSVIRESVTQAAWLTTKGTLRKNPAALAMRESLANILKKCGV